jgi:hypothetical protein
VGQPLQSALRRNGRSHARQRRHRVARRIGSRIRRRRAGGIRPGVALALPRRQRLVRGLGHRVRHIRACDRAAHQQTVGVPQWLKPAVQTEFFIKTGLVILGASLLFMEVLQAGALGIIQAVLVVFVVLYACMWLCRKRVDDEFGAMLSTAVSICGVSAAIAACGAIQGDKKKLSYGDALCRARHDATGPACACFHRCAGHQYHLDTAARLFAVRRGHRSAAGYQVALPDNEAAVGEAQVAPLFGPPQVGRAAARPHYPGAVPRLRHTGKADCVWPRTALSTTGKSARRMLLRPLPRSSPRKPPTPAERQSALRAMLLRIESRRPIAEVPEGVDSGEKRSKRYTGVSASKVSSSRNSVTAQSRGFPGSPRRVASSR